MSAFELLRRHNEREILQVVMMTPFDGRSGRSNCAAAVVALGFSVTPALSGGPQTACKSAFASFSWKHGTCSAAALISEKLDPNGAAPSTSAARAPLAFLLGQSVSTDSEGGGSLMIQCGRNAEDMHAAAGSREEIMGLPEIINFSLCALGRAARLDPIW